MRFHLFHMLPLAQRGGLAHSFGLSRRVLPCEMNGPGPLCRSVMAEDL
jgi:hypothetical protein